MATGATVMSTTPWRIHVIGPSGATTYLADTKPCRIATSDSDDELKFESAEDADDVLACCYNRMRLNGYIADVINIEDPEAK